MIIFAPYSGVRAATGFTCGKNLLDTIGIIYNTGTNKGNIVDAPYALFSMIGCVLKQATDYILWLGGAIAVIMIIISGIRYMAASGNSSAQQSAMKALNAAVIGLAIIACFWSVFNFIVEGILQVYTITGT